MGTALHWQTLRPAPSPAVRTTTQTAYPAAPAEPLPIIPTPVWPRAAIRETPEETETAEIPEGETPLAEAPKTGDELALWILAAAESGTGLIWLTISGKKRKHDGEKG